MRIKYIHFLILVFYANFGNSQDNTVGVLSYDFNKVSPGYNLIYPHFQSTAYLLNNCGQVVNQWPDTDTDYRPGVSVYLNDNGELARAKRSNNFNNDVIWAPGGGEIIELLDWDGEVIWSFKMNDSINRLHHDFALMRNGNVIMLAWELKSKSESLDAGRDPDLLPDDVVYSDWIFEYDPIKDSIIWEWHAWDHLVQDFDATKNNFDVISESPSRINLNYNTNEGGADWLHSNAIDYDRINDHILLSVPHFDEVWVIDHSTTTEEAKTDRGGFSGQGGKLLYRWGNPKAYDKAIDNDDQTLFFSHNFHIVDDFASSSSKYKNMYAAFNNRVADSYSSAVFWTSPYDMYQGRFPMQNGRWGPDSVEIEITHPAKEKLYSNIVSSVEVLPNDNLLILGGREGYAFELDGENNVVWEYKIPLRSGEVVAQGTNLSPSDNITFSMTRFPEDFNGFEGKDLSGSSYLELTPNEEFCLISNVEEHKQKEISIYPLPASEVLNFEHRNGIINTLSISDVSGRKVIELAPNTEYVELNVASLKTGIYFALINETEIYKISIVK